MSRPGVTYQDIAAAANQVKGQGKNPTIENVRAVLGTGSIGTINNHLRKWKETQNSTQKIASKENLPEELVSLMKGLWERMLAESENRITTLEESFQTTLAEVQEELQKYKTNNQRWQHMYNQWLQEKNQLTTDKQTQAQAIESLQKELAASSQKNEAQVKQLDEKQDRIVELNRLLKQTQDNLEHYREAAREQRLLDLEQFEQQKLELQSQLKHQKEQLAVITEKANTIQQHYLNQQQTNALIQKELEHAVNLYEKSLLTIADLEKLTADYKNSSQQWQSQYEQSQKIISQQSQQLMEFKADNQLLSQGMESIQQQLKEALAQIKLLSHDKWIIIQEKSNLEGQLKQLQALVHA